MLKRLFKKPPERKLAEDLYDRIVQQARRPELYTIGQVPDTVDGRFDLVALHAFLVLHRLKDGLPDTKDLSQAVFDVMFENLDEALREIGVGDLSVGKKINQMAQAFYGRVAAYEDGLAGGDDGNALENAVHRNLYRAADMQPQALTLMVDYIRRQMQVLANQPIDRFIEGEVAFEPLIK